MNEIDSDMRDILCDIKNSLRVGGGECFFASHRDGVMCSEMW